MTLASRILGSLAKLPPRTTPGVAVERDLPAKMADGETLLADHWFPIGAGADAAPIVLLRSPYGRRQLGIVGRLFAERGYQTVIQSCRGTFGSGGQWVPFRNEQSDGRATLEWMADQEWWHGDVATFGPSYLGLTQWSVVDGAPDFLKAMALDVTASDFRNAVVYPSECFALETALTWIYQVEHQEQGWRRTLGAQLRSRKALGGAFDVLPLSAVDTAAVGRRVEFFQDWLTHETPGDPWWDPVDFARHRQDLPPSSFVGGWYDLFLPNQLDDYQAVRAAGGIASLTIGPWSHVSPGVLGASLRDALKLFDENVHDGSGTTAGGGAVRVYVMGSRRWVELDHWPPMAEIQRWHLGAQGSLQLSVGTTSAPDRYRYDPADPTPSVGGPSLNRATAGSKDQHRRESRADVLTYTSETLAQDVTVIGPLDTQLYVRTSLEHTDFFVRLCDVAPNGRSKNVSDGIVRLHPGNVTRSADGSVSTWISMWPTAHTFKRGHRIRLQVSSGAHPLFARNTGSGEPLATATRLLPTDQEIFHDADHPSMVVLPVTTL